MSNCNPCSTDPIATAVKLIQSAADDLQAVARALANIGRERMAA